MALRIFESRFRFMSASPQGPVGLHLRKQGVRIETAAKLLATQEKLVRSGQYRAGIGNFLTSDGTGLVLKILATAPHSRIIERGSEAHVIAARRRLINAFGNITPAGRNGFPTEGGLWWTQKPNVGGRAWFVPDYPLQQVKHPGTKGYWILRRAVRQVLGGSATA